MCRLLDLGVRCFLTGSDQGFLRQGAVQAVKAVRATGAAYSGETL
jgi:hypothetical protein